MSRILCLIAAAAICFAQHKPAASPIEWKSPVEDKNFYLLAMIERTPELRKLFHDDAALARVAQDRVAALDNAVTNCRTQIECYASALRWSNSDADQVRESLARLYKSSNAMRGLVQKLRTSGMYVRYNDLEDTEMLGRAWADGVAGMNRAIDVYGLGIAPRYPAIDSATYDVKTPGGARNVANLAAVLD